MGKIDLEVVKAGPKRRKVRKAQNKNVKGNEGKT